MYTADSLVQMRGLVSGEWVSPSSGVAVPLKLRGNQLSYSCADAIARVMAGDSSWRPTHIGFIYGTEADPAALASATSRDQTWADIGTNLAEIDGNIQVSELSRPPFTRADSGPVEGASYQGNSVVFSAATQSGVGGVYGFPNESPYAGVFSAGHYLYHAVLLCSPSDTFVPLARVSLASASGFGTKPPAFELVLDWAVSFY
jgi:hypothetical protein